MHSDVRRDLDRSGRAFVEIVWPIIEKKRWLGDCEFMSLEEVHKSELSQLLDMYAGFDGLLFYPDGVAGIASRIQSQYDENGKLVSIGSYPYNTFTVRSERDNGAPTELEKRRAAIKSDGKFLYPHITVQSYLETWNGPCLSVAMIRTKHLIGIIDHPETTKKHCREKRTSNATFKIVPWDAIKTHPLAEASDKPLIKIYPSVGALANGLKTSPVRRPSEQELIEKQGRFFA